jgi:hypothetical protein
VGVAVTAGFVSEVVVCSGGAEQDDKSPARKIVVLKMRRVFVMPSHGEFEVLIISSP